MAKSGLEELRIVNRNRVWGFEFEVKAKNYIQGFGDFRDEK